MDSKKRQSAAFTRELTREIAGIPMRFISSGRARRINISLRPFQGVRVAVPRGVSFELAEQFVQEKLPWIQSRLRRIAEVEARSRAAGQTRTTLDRDQAKAVIIARLNHLARTHGFTYNRVFIRAQKTRWGSCSGKNNINLNVKLLCLPSELMDYVILHELVHTRIKDHGARFWAELEKHLPQARETDRRLNLYSPALIQAF